MKLRALGLFSMCMMVGACGSNGPSRMVPVGSSGDTAAPVTDPGLDADGDGLSDQPSVAVDPPTPLTVAPDGTVVATTAPAGTTSTGVVTTVAGTAPPPDGTIEFSEIGITDVPQVSSDGQALPIIGGTLLTSADGQRAVASDPDRDAVYVVALADLSLTHTVPLENGDVPARLVEDAAGLVHVVARGSGDLVSLDVESGEVVERRSVCGAPRGLAYDAEADQLLVACRTGELVWLPPSGEIERSQRVAVDLRDVVLDGQRILVSTFRQAKVLVLDREGTLEKTLSPNTISGPDGIGLHEPHVARHMKPVPGGFMMQHQRSNRSSAHTGSYSGFPGCGSAMIQNTVSLLSSDAITFQDSGVFAQGFMSDFAVSPDGSSYASVSIGRVDSHLGMGELGPRVGDGCNTNDDHHSTIPGQATAVTFSNSGAVVVQTREPAALHVVGVGSVELSSESRADTGQQIFHMDSGSGISCASCHPEGEEDGTTWPFIDVGLRRTQSLVGGILETAPLHWEGDRENLGAVMLDTFVQRMGGQMPSEEQLVALEGFVQSLRASPPPAALDEAALGRGQALFEQAQCNACHAGERLTDNKNYDVGTGGMFQVPSLLGVAYRAPYMHDGCARTLAERFDATCGGDQHGDVAELGDEEISDLVVYLESL